ncbi:hypothetical protein OPV22_026267 [Ensete ventricosum]|uniref:SWIRM domain-containing protein n=1 Tax=Ensete ventricosum TaxID=4639 RepID=A0AAV8QFD2_ENSVE|nr:hypothetical protein OPV22_026267 [Ensete ventricosum]
MPPSSEGSDLADRELYSIPSSSSWFRWDDIDDTERRCLPEFFDGSSTSRNPRVYKEYRDFIISKYREDPTKFITFTEIRKSLIGDVGYLHKVFLFLEKWGLINFGAKVAAVEPKTSVEDSGPKVVVEEGPPVDVQVVPACITQRKLVGMASVGGENGFKLPPLTSYSDVFGDWLPKRGLVCGICGDQSAAGGYESFQDGVMVCSKCSKNNSQADDRTTEDSNHQADDGTKAEGSANKIISAWTDAETLLLLEAVLKHGDDWDLIAQHVRTKSKLDCIARLIQLPFELIKTDLDIQTDEKDLVEEPVAERPLKRRCLPSFVHAADTLRKQVAGLSTVAGPQIATAAADAAIVALCSENISATKHFSINKYGENDLLYINNDHNSGLKIEDQEMELHKQTVVSEKSSSATAFQVRAAIATALGAVAARAKLLADQEEREIELLMASIIEVQLRKIQCKIKHFEELESVMEHEYTLLQKVKESILEEWVMVLQQAFQAGIPRWSDDGLPKPFTTM